MGEQEFLNLVTVLTLHIDPQNLKIPIIGPKKKCRRAYIWVSKPIRRKIQVQWKKISSIRHTSEEKNPKNHPKIPLF